MAAFSASTQASNRSHQPTSRRSDAGGARSGAATATRLTLPSTESEWLRNRPSARRRSKCPYRWVPASMPTTRPYGWRGSPVASRSTSGECAGSGDNLSTTWSTYDRASRRRPGETRRRVQSLRHPFIPGLRTGADWRCCKRRDLAANGTTCDTRARALTWRRSRRASRSPPRLATRAVAQQTALGRAPECDGGA
jgi:hypothetical protein